MNGEEYTNIRDLVSELGNGDFERGHQLLALVSGRIREARFRQPVFARGRYNALGAVESEFEEFKEAIFRESRTRQVDEALDVITTCARFINGEYLGGEYLEAGNGRG